MTPNVSNPDRGRAKLGGFFPKEAFSFDGERDGYLCPGGRFLRRRGAGERGSSIPRRTYTGYNVRTGCELKTKCTTGNFRQLKRYGKTLERTPRIARHPKANCRTPIWNDQAMDEPGRVLDAPARKRSRRIQPDNARLQHPPGNHSGRNSGPYRSDPGVTAQSAPEFCKYRPKCPRQISLCSASSRKEN